MEKKHVFVTGASGFVGRYLIPELIKLNYEVTIFVRENSFLDNVKDLPIQIRKGDILNKQELEAALPKEAVVVHLAALLRNATYGEYYDIHVEGTKNLIAACKEKGIKRIIAISTTSTLAQKRTPYGETKKIADLLFQASKLDITILKPDFIYGKGGPGFTNIVNIVKKFPIIPVIGDGKYRKQPIHVTDVVKAILSALEYHTTIGKSYVVAGNESIPFEDIIKAIKEELQIKKTIFHLPKLPFYSLAYVLRNRKNAPFTKTSLEGLFQDCHFDITSLKEELHVIPMKFNDGLKISL